MSKEQPDQVSQLKVLWVSPSFGHCVFTASKGFDQGLASRFTNLMLAMDPNHPLASEVMRLERTRKWVARSPEGFQELVKAMREEPRCHSAESCP